MDPVANNSGDCRDFSGLFLFIPTVFFGIYLFFILAIPASVITGIIATHLSDTSLMRYVSGMAFSALLPAISCGAGILMIIRMKKRSLDWRPLIPFCLITGVLTLSLFGYLSNLSYQDSSVYTMDYFWAVVFSFTTLPACSALFLTSWKKNCGGIGDTEILIANAIGLVGIALLIFTIVSAMAYVPPPPSPNHDSFMEFPLLGYNGTLCWLFYLAIVLPGIGLLFIMRWDECRKVQPLDQTR